MRAHNAGVGCPSQRVLVDYDLGRLGPRDIEEVAAHLEHCPRCLAGLLGLSQDTDHFVVELRENAHAAPAPDEPWITEGIEAMCLHTPRPAALPNRSTAALERAPTQPETPEGEAGRLGSYDLLEVIGQGGMGRVYMARHVHLNKVVALKTLPPDLLGDPEAVARFRAEIQVVGNLNHRNIVQAFDAAVTGVPYLVMELLVGLDLSQLLKAHGPLEIADACECVRQTALALQHTHEQGLVHRDIKPSNLMLTTEGVVKLLDLGLARAGADASADPTRAAGPGLTGEGSVVGTVDYIAPEQLHARAVDIRADLYSLGCTLYHLLAGQPPFAMPGYSTQAKQQAHLHDFAADVRRHRPEIPPALALVVDQLLAKDPGHRFASPAGLAAALEQFCGGHRLTQLVNSKPAQPATGLGDTPSAPTALTSVGVGVAKRLDPRLRPAPPPLQSAAPGASSGAKYGMLLVLLGALGAIYLVAWQMNKKEAETQAEDRANAAWIDTLDVEYVRPNERGQPTTGKLSADAPRTRNSAFRATVRFNEPVYCYVIAYQPDGTDVLCHPAQADEAPGQRQSVAYPTAGYFNVSNPGVYTVVVISSRNPLPRYDVWRARANLSLLFPADAEGVWTFDSQAGLPHETRPPTCLRNYCLALEQLPNQEAFQGVSFSVR